MATVFIDESGTFQPLTPPSRKVSCIAALIVASRVVPDLLREFRQLASTLPQVNGEVKGSRLDEPQVASVLSLLARYDALVEVVAIDAGAHPAPGITAFRRRQAQLIDRHAQHNPDARVRERAARVRDHVESMSDQLFVQAWLTMLLVERVAETVTLYFAVRAPRELATFEWIVDAKGASLTRSEEFWVQFVLPFTETRSAVQPFRIVPNGDYAHFARFFLPPREPDPRSRRARGAAKTSRGTIDFRAILTEHLTFGDSTAAVGLQLADVVANATARAFNNNLQVAGWGGLRELLVGVEPQVIQLTELTLIPHRSGRRIYLNGGHEPVMQRLHSHRPSLIPG